MIETGEAATAPRRSIVYFLQDTVDKAIKIGTTTLEAEQRMVMIAKETKRSLVVLATIDGGYEVEQALHRCFDGLRIRGEWFTPGPALVAFIDSVHEGHQKRAQRELANMPTVREGPSMAKNLVDAIDAHVRSESNEDGYQDVAKRAGMSKQQLANLRRKVAADPGHVINSDVAERLADAIDYEVKIAKKGAKR